jgi:hypothetical protein
VIQRIKDAVRQLVREELHATGTREGFLVHALRGQLAAKETAITALQDHLARARADLLRVRSERKVQVPFEQGGGYDLLTVEQLLARFNTQRKTIRVLLDERVYAPKEVVPTWTNSKLESQPIQDLATPYLVNILRKYRSVLPHPPVLKLIFNELATRKQG